MSGNANANANANGNNNHTAPLIWIDLEMSGLDADSCRILEIATLVTDDQLEVIAEGPDLVIHWPDSVLDDMDAWCTQHHRDSGLTDAVKTSDISEREAERQTLAFLEQHCSPGRCPLCGNSVWQDRRFIDRYMPSLGAFLHYRTVDVSTIKELVYRWYPNLELPKKQESHRALGDIRESIEELRYYRQHVFQPPRS
jgi:oligoribonuclease